MLTLKSPDKRVLQLVGYNTYGSESIRAIWRYGSKSAVFENETASVSNADMDALYRVFNSVTERLLQSP